MMQSSGGILTADAARSQAVRTLLSGPAAGALGAFHVAAQAGEPRVITFDMGGTSTDACLIDGRVPRTSEGSVEGWPVRMPMIDIHTVGAGGGSIAWVDAGGALRVGPMSAGSDPGPACYGLGGAAFTVTDANLVLGRLHPDHFLGGRMALDPAAAAAAGQAIADRLGLSVEDLAEGVVRVADARMEQALRVISVARGADPRGFALLPFGGAGPIHALSLAEALRIPRVLIPLRPGVLSALGLALADFTVDFSQTVMLRPAEGGLDGAAAALAQAFGPLEGAGRAALGAEGFAAARRAAGAQPGPALPGPVVRADCAVGRYGSGGRAGSFPRGARNPLRLCPAQRGGRDRQRAADRPRDSAEAGLCPCRRPNRPTRPPPGSTAGPCTCAGAGWMRRCTSGSCFRRGLRSRGRR